MSLSSSEPRVSDEHSATDIDGAIDLVRDGLVLGWAWNRAEADMRLSVTVFADGVPVATAKADGRRSDLRRAGIGDGAHGFAVLLPEELAARGAVVLRVRAGDTELQAAAAFRHAAHPAGPWHSLALGLGQPPELPGPTVEGGIDSLTSDGVAGWVRAPLEPAERLPVSLVLDGAVVSQERADRERRDLAESGLGDGRYGFVLPLPPGDLPAEARLEVRAGDPPLRLTTAPDWMPDDDSPAALALLRGAASAARVEGRVDAVRNGTVIGWAWQPYAPEQRVSVRALLDGVVVATSLADKRRRDLQREGLGDGLYGFELPLPADRACGSDALLEVLAGDLATPLQPSAAFAVRGEPADPWTAGKLRIAAPAAGWLEGIRDGRVLGRAAPGAPVEVVLDGELVAAGAADEVADSNGAIPGAFSVPLLPGVISARTHLIRVRAGRPGRLLAPAPWWDGTGSGAGWDRVHFDVQEREPVALVGRDGWLFLAGDEESTLDQALGRRTAVAEDVRAWVQGLVTWQRRLVDLQVAYVFAVAPLKERLYSEMLPVPAPATPGRVVDALRATLRGIPEVDVLDLLPVLQDAAADGALYARTDTAWTERGALHAARALLKEAYKHGAGTVPRRLPEGSFVEGELLSGNLLGLRKVVLQDGALAPAPAQTETSLPVGERVERLDPGTIDAQRVPADEQLVEVAGRPVRVYEQAGAPELPRAVLVGDALGHALTVPLAQQFSRLVFFRSPTPPLEAIELESPDVVFHVKDERFLVWPPGARGVEAVG